MTERHNRSQQAALRKLLTPHAESGQAICPRCGTPVHPWQPWDVGHVIPLWRDPHQAQADPEDLYAQGLVRVEHRFCNRSAGATQGNKRRRQRRPRVIGPRDNR